MTKNFVSDILLDALELHRKIVEDTDFIESIALAAQTIVDALKNEKKIIVAGNGGSAADSQHFVAELVGRFQKERDGLPAIALSTNTSSITALANDYSFDEIFSHQLKALGSENDVFFAITTSGRSKNILNALDAAQKIGMRTIGLLGKGGGPAAEQCDISIIVPHDITARIQEIHILTIHTICAYVDENF